MKKPDFSEWVDRIEFILEANFSNITKSMIEDALEDAYYEGFKAGDNYGWVKAMEKNFD